MRNQKKLVLRQLDNKLAPFYQAAGIKMPEKGWIHTIRTSLNMTLEQLGHKMGISKQGVKKLEENEANAVISIKSLNEIGKSMEMKLVYAFVPLAGSFENLVDEKARKLATRIVSRTNQSMKLENQGVREEQLSEAIEELTAELKRELRKTIWD